MMHATPKSSRPGHPIRVTGATGRIGAVGRTMTELLLKQGKSVRATVRNENERAQALRDMDAEVHFHVATSCGRLASLRTTGILR
jgi:nucleoside-diphosphate-sugar epimerase